MWVRLVSLHGNMSIYSYEEAKEMIEMHGDFADFVGGEF